MDDEIADKAQPRQKYIRWEVSEETLLNALKKRAQEQKALASIAEAVEIVPESIIDDVDMEDPQSNFAVKPIPKDILENPKRLPQLNAILRLNPFGVDKPGYENATIEKKGDKWIISHVSSDISDPRGEDFFAKKDVEGKKVTVKTYGPLSVTLPKDALDKTTELPMPQTAEERVIAYMAQYKNKGISVEAIRDEDGTITHYDIKGPKGLGRSSLKQLSKGFTDEIVGKVEKTARKRPQDHWLVPAEVMKTLVPEADDLPAREIAEALILDGSNVRSGMASIDVARQKDGSFLVSDIAHGHSH